MKNNQTSGRKKVGFGHLFLFLDNFISIYHVFYASLCILDGRESTLPLFGCVPLALAAVDRVTACGFVDCASDVVEV